MRGGRAVCASEYFGPVTRNGEQPAPKSTRVPTKKRKRTPRTPVTSTTRAQRQAARELARDKSLKKPRRAPQSKVKPTAEQLPKQILIFPKQTTQPRPPPIVTKVLPPPPPRLPPPLPPPSIVSLPSRQHRKSQSRQVGSLKPFVQTTPPSMWRRKRIVGTKDFLIVEVRARQTTPAPRPSGQTMLWDALNCLANLRHC